MEVYVIDNIKESGTTLRSMMMLIPTIKSKPKYKKVDLLKLLTRKNGICNRVIIYWGNQIALCCGGKYWRDRMDNEQIKENVIEPLHNIGVAITFYDSKDDETYGNVEF